jgi:hypothetical protein
MEDPAAPYKKRPKAQKRTPRKKRSVTQAPEKAKAKKGIGKSRTKTVSKRGSPKKKSRSPYDTVVGIVRRSRKGVTIAKIREKTGFDDRQIRNFIYKAKRQDKIKILKRGVYVGIQ